MKLRIISDLHIEFWRDSHRNPEKLIRTLQYALPESPEDHETTLIIAGDFTNYNHLDAVEILLEYLSGRFEHIVYIPGNHEPYYGPFNGTNELLGEICSLFPNVTFGEQVMHGHIIGATLWTDFAGRNPLTMQVARVGMNDYRLIKQDAFFVHTDMKCPPITPEMVLGKHETHLNYLKTVMTSDSIVVTHHAPSQKSIHEGYRSSDLNPCYFSHLEYLIEEKQPRLWIHGHVHMPFDYLIGTTRVICNPHGYLGYENTGYDRMFTVEV